MATPERICSSDGARSKTGSCSRGAAERAARAGLNPHGSNGSNRIRRGLGERRGRRHVGRDGGHVDRVDACAEVPRHQCTCRDRVRRFGWKHGGYEHRQRPPGRQFPGGGFHSAHLCDTGKVILPGYRRGKEQEDARVRGSTDASTSAARVPACSTGPG